MSEYRQAVIGTFTSAAVTGISTIVESCAQAHTDQVAFLYENIDIDGVVRNEARAAVQSRLLSALEAGTPVALTAAVDAIVEIVAHEQVAIAQTLVVPALQSAAEQGGFTETTVVQQADSSWSFIAENPKGQAITAEIVSAVGAPLRIRTETLGIVDGSCTNVLNQLEQGLAQEGIHLTPIERRSTLRRQRVAAHQRIRR